MLSGLDHVVLAVADPDAAAEELRSGMGLDAGAGGRHDELGTFNRLVWLGDSYVELLGVFDRQRAAGSWLGGPALSALERGEGFVAFAIASNDFDADVARLRRSGSPLVGPTPGSRARPDGGLVRWRLALPPDLATEPWAFLIEHDPAGAEWDEPSRATRAAQVHSFGAHARLERLELAVGDPARSSTRFQRHLGISFRPSLGAGGARDAALGAQTLRLRRVLPGTPNVTMVIRTVEVGSPAGKRGAEGSVPSPCGGPQAATPRRSTDLLGCRFVLDEA